MTRNRTKGESLKTNTLHISVLVSALAYHDFNTIYDSSFFMFCACLAFLGIAQTQFLVLKFLVCGVFNEIQPLFITIH